MKKLISDLLQNLNINAALDQISSAKSIFTLQNSDDDCAVFHVCGYVGDDWDGLTAIDVIKFINENPEKKIVFEISSPGGIVDQALYIYDTIKKSKNDIETIIYGASASAATIWSQAASKGSRMMSANAMMLIHHAWTISLGNQFDMKKTAEMLASFDERLISIYKKNGASDQLEKLMAEDGGHGIWINAQQALEYGLIDQILDVDKPDSDVNPKNISDDYTRASQSQIIKQLKF